MSEAPGALPDMPAATLPAGAGVAPGPAAEADHMDEEQKQAIIDADHLSLLRIGYFVSSGVTAFFGLIGLLYAAMGWAMAATMPQMPPGPDATSSADVGMFFVLIGGGMAFFAGIAAILKLYVAGCLKRRRSRGLCLVVAAGSCFEIPYGTVLGVFTMIALSRSSVQKLFSEPDAAPGPDAG